MKSQSSTFIIFWNFAMTARLLRHVITLSPQYRSYLGGVSDLSSYAPGSLLYTRRWRLTVL